MAIKGKTSGKSRKAVDKNKKKSWTLWISSMLFISMWMFVLGVLVGRGTAPVPFDIHKLQKELKHLKETALRKEEIRFKILSNADHKNFEFHDALKKRAPGKAVKKTDSKFKKKLLKKKPHAKDTRLNRQKEAAVGSKKTGKNAVEKFQKPETVLTIQVASFKNKKDADLMISRMKKKGYRAYRALGIIPGKGVWYRVRVGHFSSKQEARKVVTRLEKENIKPIIVGQSKK
jgi:DedD protein